MLAAATSAAPTAFFPFPPRQRPFCCAAFLFTVGTCAGELCTPTGAALLTQFAARFGDMPPMRVERIGYGMGRKDFPAANCVRALLGETEDSARGRRWSLPAIWMT